jgi:hypothetical protein
LNVLNALFCAFLVYFAISYTLSFLEIKLITGIAIFLGGITIATIFFKKNIHTGKKSIPKKLTFFALFFRLLFIVIAVLSITKMAEIIGAKWAGLIASFPTTLCPLLIVLMYLYKDKIYPTFLKNFSYGVTATFVFYLLALFTFPKVGIYYGTIIAYLVCFGYLYFLNKMLTSKLIQKGIIS